MLIAIATGSSPLDVSQIGSALSHAPWAQLDNSQDKITHLIVWQIRMPRVLVAAGVGAALALAGAQMQSLLQNPLASPDILGVSAGAALGAVLLLISGWAMQAIWVLPLGAWLGSTLALLCVVLLSRAAGHGRYGNSLLSLLLVGIALNALFSAVISLLISLSWVQHEITREIMFWLMGGLENRTWTHVGLLLPGLLLGAALAYYHRRELDLLLCGEESAAALGMNIKQVRYRLLAGIALLTAAAVAVAGMIGFVGLIVPHVARLLVGPQHQRLLPASALIGAILLVSVDLLSNQLSPDGSLRLGILTALLGAPFFLFLLLRQPR